MGVYLTTKMSHGTKYVVVVENYYEDKEDGTRVRRQRTIESLGPLDKLTQNDPNALELLKSKYQSAAVKRNLSRKESLEQLSANQSECDASVFDGYPVTLNYGIWALKPIWEKDLNLKYFFKYIQSGTNIEYDTNAVLSYLCYQKILEPCSQFRAYREQTKYCYDPLKDISLKDLYRSLDFICEHKEQVLGYINKQLKDNYDRNLSMIFYDCTNCYFETSLDDKQRLSSSIIHEIKKELVNSGMTTEQIATYIGSDEFNVKFNARFNEILEENEEALFRMRGLSKEHRYDLPLVSIALVVDTDGIPVDFEVFKGNISEYATMPEVIQAMCDKYQIKDTIVVADRGLNSVANLKMLESHNLGFIVAQKVSNLKPEYEQIMLNTQGYSKISEITNDTDDATTIYKKADFKKIAMLEITPGKRKRQIVDCQIVFTFNQARKDRDIMQLESDIIIAKNAVEQAKDMAPNGGCGWRGLVKVKKEEYEAQSPQDKALGRSIFKATAIKEDVIAKRRKLAGYAAYIYKKPAQQEDELEDKKLFRAYHKLLKIEDCFRVMKTNLEVRPMYVRNHNHIVGHVTLCVIALIMLRLLEKRLHKQNSNLSINQIGVILRNANVTAISKTGQDGVFVCSNTLQGIYNKEIEPDLNKASNALNLIGVDEYVKILNKTGTPINQILQAVELTPLPYISEPNTLANCLKLKKGYIRIVGDLTSELQYKMSQQQVENSAPNK